MATKEIDNVRVVDNLSVETKGTECDNVVDAFRHLVDTYVVYGEERGRWVTNQIPVSVLSEASELLGKLLSSHQFSNIEAEIKRIYLYLDHLVRGEGFIQVELQMLYIHVCIEGIKNDSLYIMQLCHYYFDCLFSDSLIDKSPTGIDLFNRMTFSTILYCGSQYGDRFVLSGLSLDYLHDRVAYLQNEKPTCHNFGYTEEFGSLIHWFIGYSFVSLAVFAYSLKLGVIISSCMVAICLVRLIRKAKSRWTMSRRFVFGPVARTLFCALSPFSVIFLPISDIKKALVLICIDVAYLFISHSVFELYRKRVAKNKFTPDELIAMFGLAVSRPLPKWLRFFIPCG